jgi:hypothetical protein
MGDLELHADWIVSVSAAKKATGDTSFWNGAGLHTGLRGDLTIEGFSPEAEPTKFFDIGGIPPASETAPTGSYTVVHVSDVALTASTDPLGLSQIYLLRHPSVSILANSLAGVVAEAKRLGIELTPDPAPLADLFCVGSPLVPSSGYREVELVPWHRYVRVWRDGRVATPERTFWQFVRERRRRDYRGLIADAAEQIKAASRWAASLPGTKIVELSGGRDSRLVLAGLRAAKVDRAFFTHTQVTSTPDDLELAIQIRRYAALQPCSAPHVFEVPLADAITFASQFGPCRMMDDITFHMATPTSPRVVLSGGCGETFRGFFSSMIVERDGDASSNGAAISTVLKEHFRSRNLAPAYVARRINEATQYVSEFGLDDPLNAVDLLYLASRNRFHFGLCGRVRSRIYTSVNTLNSPLAVAASYCLSGLERARGKVGYDLMRHLDPGLAELPFTGSAWHPSIRRRFALRWVRTPTIGPDRPIFKLNNPTAKQGIRAREIASRDAFRSLVDSSPESLRALLNVAHVRRTASHDDGAARVGRRLGGALHWYIQAAQDHQPVLSSQPDTSHLR